MNAYHIYFSKFRVYSFFPFKIILQYFHTPPPEISGAFWKGNAGWKLSNIQSFARSSGIDKRLNRAQLACPSPSPPPSPLPLPHGRQPPTPRAALHLHGRHNAAAGCRKKSNFISTGRVASIDYWSWPVSAEFIAASESSNEIMSLPFYQGCASFKCST